MAFYHVGGCDCPVGCCDCGPEPDPVPKVVTQTDLRTINFAIVVDFSSELRKEPILMFAGKDRIYETWNLYMSEPLTEMSFKQAERALKLFKRSKAAKDSRVQNIRIARIEHTILSSKEILVCG